MPKYPALKTGKYDRQKFCGMEELWEGLVYRLWNRDIVAQNQRNLIHTEWKCCDEAKYCCV